MRAELRKITDINTPITFSGEGLSRYKDVFATFQNGVYCLVASGKEGVMLSTSRDLRRWQKPVVQEDIQCLFSMTDLLGEGIDKEQLVHMYQEERPEGYSIVWDEELSMYVKFYLSGAGQEMEGCKIHLAVSKDLKHWQCFERDKATAPERGVIYDGDYYRAIPFGQYIHNEILPKNQKIFDIRDYGAIADDAIISTEPFQAAAEAARDAGGGIILVTGGYYCIGAVRVYSNTTLWIDMDSALCASKNLSNYGDALITCMDAENVCLRGGGKIIGNGEYFAYLPLKRPLLDPLEKTKLPPSLYDPMGYPVDTIRYAYRARIRYAEDKYAEGLKPIDRPMYTVWISGCENVCIENIVIEDALDWTLVLDGSQKVQVKDMIINGNRHVANTDGIDIMGCSQVEIDHCFISCADDGLCIKAPRKREHDGIQVKGCLSQMKGTNDIHISNCVVISVMNAFKIGTETYFDIENISMEKCKFMLPDIFPGTVSGISIESADGAHVRNIKISDIEMDKVCCPVFICLNKRNKFGFGEDRERRDYGGIIENVIIERVNAKDVEVPGIITGFRMKEEEKIVGRKVKDIAIRDFYAIYRDNIEELNLKENVYENITDYPENNAFGDVPAYGFYIRHGENVTVTDYCIVPRSMNQRQCIVWED